MIGAEPMIAASVIADVPNWFFSLTFAPALISARTSSRSSFAAAHMIAVVPSGPGAFGSAPFGQQAQRGRAIAALGRVEQRGLGGCRNRDRGDQTRKRDQCTSAANVSNARRSAGLACLSDTAES